MSLNFYADSALTLPISLVSPKRFLFPDAGGTKSSQLWLGDPYTSTCTIQANPGNPVVNLSDTSEFLTNVQISATSHGYATAVSGSNTFTYTGKTQDQLTGVSGITSIIHQNDVVYPQLVYSGINGTNISVYPSGPDLLNYGIRVAVGATSVLGFPGLPAIFSQNSINMGVANAVEVFLSVQVPAGADQVFTNLSVQCNGLYLHDINDATPYTQGQGAYGPIGSLYAYRHDESLPVPVRVLPVNRQVQPNAPGFVVGQYRWRDASTANATALVPTNWNINPTTIGLEKFTAGIGDLTDLAPLGLVQDGNSVRMQIQEGEYFTGANRYYLPASPVLEILPVSFAATNTDGSITLQLQASPKPQTPIFVGTYTLDTENFYEAGLGYRYEATLTNPDGSARTDLPPYYFTIDRQKNIITLNKSLPEEIVYLGPVSGLPQDYFSVGIYPVDNISVVYVNQGANAPFLYATSWTFDRSTGNIVVPSIPGALQGEPLFAICDPAVAILYDTGTADSREITTVDFNPAFSGLAGGYFYLQHTVQTPTSLVLSCDKPVIAIPATQSTIIGLIAYGPVYFQNDFALLVVTAYGPIAGETIPNAVLNVVVNPQTFSGTLNYQDPLVTPVSVVTGGDGTANLIFIPKPGFGVWIPTTAASGGLAGLATTNITGDTLVLPVGVPIGQIWNPQEGWLVTTYTIFNNDPLLGMIGAIPSLGEVPWATSGTPGTPGYKTNGQIQVWTLTGTSTGTPVLPIDALDSGGHSYTNASFNGNVTRLVYAKSIPTGIIVGAYFLTYVQRILIQMQLANSDVISNSILLQMQFPLLINEDPWLILNDAIQGRLNQFRLGFAPASQTQI